LVCPAADIWKVLHMTALKTHRDQIDAALHQQFASPPAAR
jgi:hypothetical protein